MDASAVDELVAQCQRVCESIAEHKRSVVALTVERDAMVRELRRLGLPERTVGRLLGISGPRVNQITKTASEAPPAPAEPPPEAAKPAEQEPAAQPRKRPAKRASATPRTVSPAPDGVPPVAFQEPAPDEPEDDPEPPRARCTHPGVGRKLRCPRCGRYNI